MASNLPQSAIQRHSDTGVCALVGHARADARELGGADEGYAASLCVQAAAFRAAADALEREALKHKLALGEKREPHAALGHAIGKLAAARERMRAKQLAARGRPYWLDDD